MAIPYLSLSITCRFTSRAQLPVFKGSTLRGAFGHNLKKVACALRKQKCDTCLLSGTCAYALIFATEKLTGERIAARPHPYILNPPVEEKRDYAPGDTLAFNLVLLGEATQFLPHIVYTVEKMGKSGLGRGNESGAGKFALESIQVDEETIYDSSQGVLKKPATLPLLSLEESRAGTGSMELCFMSPLRLKSGNEFMKSLSFSTLVRASMRRIASLEKCYGPGEPDIDFRGLSMLAEAVDTVDVDVRWRDYKRYSSRQKRDMFLGGLVGRVALSGELSPFVPLFQYVQHVNLGKQTAFGLGRLQVVGVS